MFFRGQFHFSLINEAQNSIIDIFLIISTETFFL